MSELIEKQVVIDWLKYKWNRSADSLFYGIQELPTTDIDLSGYSDKLWKAAYERGKRDAQPERKTGKWIKPTDMMPPEYAGIYRCSECDEIAMRDWKRHCQTLTKYCPYCGAKMKEGD